MSDPARPPQRRVTLDRKTYIWSGTGWYEERSFLVPSEHLIRRLNEILEEQLAAEDLKIEDADDALQRAKVAQSNLQLTRAQRLARRALEIDRSHVGVAAVLCSVLRALGRPEEALRDTTPLRTRGYRPLLTSRAAALCGLERWEEAKVELGRVLAAGAGPKAFAVMRRIRAERPDLYPGHHD